MSHFTLPRPQGPDGRELSAEELDRLSQEPEFVPVELVRNGQKVTFHVAADFDRVGQEADQAYQLLKSAQYKIHNDPRLRAGLSKEEIKEGAITGLQHEKLVEMNPRKRAVFAALVGPAILGASVPGMPDPAKDAAAVREWLLSGAQTATLVLEALVMAYDPTGPLAAAREARQRQEELVRELEAEVMSQMRRQIASAEMTPPEMGSAEMGSAGTTEGETEPEATPSDAETSL